MDFFEDALLANRGRTIHDTFQKLGLQGFEEIADDVRKLYKASKNVILKFVEYSNDLSSLDKNSIISGELSKYVNANLDIFFLPKKTFYEFIEEVKKYE